MILTPKSAMQIFILLSIFFSLFIKTETNSFDVVTLQRNKQDYDDE